MLAAKFKRLTRVLPMILLRIAGAGITGGLAVYVARLYGAEFSGQFFLFVSSITILSVLTRLGAEPYLTSHIAPEAGESARPGGRYLASTFAAVASMVAVAALVLVAVHLISQPLADRFLGELPLYLLILAVLGVNMVWLVGAYCRAIGLAGLSIFVETGLLYLWLLVLLEIARTTSVDLSVTNLAFGVFLLLPILLAPLILIFRQQWRSLFRLRSISDAARGISSFGAVTVTNGIIMLIPLQALGFYGMTDEAGIYNAALRVSMFVGAFGVVIKSAIVRQVVVKAARAEDRYRDVVLSATVALPFVAASLVIAWQSHLLVSLFGPEFAGIESIILVMLFSQCVNVAGNIIETRAVIAKETRNLNVTAAVTLAVALAATPPLVGHYGLEGAAWAFALTVTASRLQLVWLYLSGSTPHRPSRERRRPDSLESA